MSALVRLHAEAPAKPAHGHACNGCGICCALEPCPVAWLLLPLAAGMCPALEWRQDTRRYVCGMIEHPGRYLRWLPRVLEARASCLFARRVAVGTGCDCDATEEGGNAPPSPT
jgi:hypothetical protein